MNKEQRLKEIEQNFNVVYVDYQPTSENLLLDFATQLQKHLPNKTKLYSIKLYETESSYVENIISAIIDAGYCGKLSRKTKLTEE